MKMWNPIQMTLTLLAAATLSLTALSAAPAQPVSGNATCDIDITIYEVRIPLANVSRIDFDALTQSAKDAATFEKKLAELGTTKPLYRIAQPVKLAGDSIALLKEEPFIDPTVRSARGATRGATARGATTTATARGTATTPASATTVPTTAAAATAPAETIIYRTTGVRITLAGTTLAPNKLNINLNINVTTISEGTIPISDRLKTGIVRTVELAHQGPVIPNQPFISVQVDASSLDPQGNAVAYIVRSTLGTPRVP
jgi:hypothetical protein